MKEVYLEDIAKIQTGKYDANHAVEEGSYKFYTCALDHFMSSTYSFEGPAIILPGNGANVGKVIFNKGGKFEAYQRTYIVYNLTANPEYVLHYFKRSWKRSVLNKQFGSATNYIRLNNLTKFKIPLPPLEDQIRIANILSRAEALIAKRKESIQLLDELLKSTFLDMFGDPVRNEKGWEVSLLGDLTNLITDGKHGNCIDNEDSGYYFISAKDINNGIIDYSKARQILQEDFEEVHKRTDLMPNDVVVVNTGATIGKTAIVKDDPKTRRTTFQKSVAIIKVKPEKLDPVYLKHLFVLRIKNLSSNSYGSAVKNMLLSEMRKFKIPLPPLTNQTQFAQIVEKTENIKTKYQKSLQELENLYASLSQKAFKGELDLSKMEIKEYKLDGHAEEGVGYGKK